MPDNNTKEHSPTINSSKNGKCVMENFTCPITLELPFNPVVAEDNHVYERTAIEEYIKSSGGPPIISPWTRQSMECRLVSLPQLKISIEESIKNGDIQGDAAEKWLEKKAMYDLLEKAEAGDADAMVRVADAFYTGSGAFYKDLYAAYDWTKKAHALGHVDGTALLGAIILHRITFMFALETVAMRYISEARARGSGVASYLLGENFARGKNGLRVNKSHGKSFD